MKPQLPKSICETPDNLRLHPDGSITLKDGSCPKEYLKDYYDITPRELIEEGCAPVVVLVRELYDQIKFPQTA